MKPIRAFLAAIVLFGAATNANANSEERGKLLDSVKSWAYQLKDVTKEKIDKIAASPYDMIIMDSSMFPNGKEIRLTRDQVESMKKKPDGSRRIIISYFSAGEAEDFRYYWKPEWNKKKPAWVYKADKDWKGDYIVRYWYPEWHKFMFGSPDALIDRIMEAGFDGLMIDRVDAYYYFGDTTERRQQMIEFVKQMSDYIRSKSPNTILIGQNAEELLVDPVYLNAIDAITKEDLVFGIKHNATRNGEDEIAYSSKLLDGAKAKGKHVFVVEYLTNKKDIATVREFHQKHNFVTYIGRQRDLYELSGAVNE